MPSPPSPPVRAARPSLLATAVSIPLTVTLLGVNLLATASTPRPGAVGPPVATDVATPAPTSPTATAPAGSAPTATATAAATGFESTAGVEGTGGFEGTGLAGVDRVVAVVAAVESVATDDSARSPGWSAPVNPAVLRERFDPPAERWSRGHRGVDLQAAAGASVGAPAPGTVVFAGRVVDRGVVTVLHDDGLRSSVEPVAASVVVGARVARGAPLGTVEDAPAATHCTPRCLHWGVRDGEQYVDPLRLLAGAGPVVLLRVPGDLGP